MRILSARISCRPAACCGPLNIGCPTKIALPFVQKCAGTASIKIIIIYNNCSSSAPLTRWQKLEKSVVLQLSSKSHLYYYLYYYGVEDFLEFNPVWIIVSLIPSTYFWDHLSEQLLNVLRQFSFVKLYCRWCSVQCEGYSFVIFVTTKWLEFWLFNLLFLCHTTKKNHGSFWAAVVENSGHSSDPDNWASFVLQIWQLFFKCHLWAIWKQL